MLKALNKILFLICCLTILISTNVFASSDSPITTQNTQLFTKENFSIQLPKEIYIKNVNTPQYLLVGMDIQNKIALIVETLPFEKDFTFTSETKKDLSNYIIQTTQAEKCTSAQQVIFIKEETINKNQVLHTRRKVLNDSMYFIKDEFTFINPTEIASVLFITPEKIYQEKEKMINNTISTVSFGLKWNTIKIPDSKYTYDLPVHYREANLAIAPDHVFLAGDEYMFTGVIIADLDSDKKYSVYPRSLKNLDIASQKLLAKYIKDEISSSIPSAKNIKYSFININGNDCIKSEFDDSTSHSISYIFIKDGKYIAFDYIYNNSDYNKIADVLKKSVNSIHL